MAQTSLTLEMERLKSLHDLRIVGTSAEAHLDSVCRVAARLFDVPMALVTLVDETTVWIHASHGVLTKTVPRCDAFCSQTIGFAAGEALVIPDLLRDERWRNASLVLAGPNARFYAGVPISLRSGVNIGTLSIMDTVARPDFGIVETKELLDLASIVEAHLRLHETRVLREQEENRYRLLADNSTDVIIRSDLNSKRRYVSPSAKAVFGYEPEELIGEHPFSFIHPDDYEMVARNLADLESARVEKGIACQRYRHKDGRWIWIEVTFSLTRDPVTGAPDGFMSALRDVSDRMAMEDALRVSEERLSLALDSGSDGLWDWNIVSGDVRRTGQWMSILGYGGGDIASNIGSWRGLVHPDDVEPSTRLLVAHLKGLAPRFECEYRVRTKSGAYAWTLARGKVVARDAQGIALRMVGTTIDITRRKEAERQVEYMASHDALTGLPNRILFQKRLAQEGAAALQHGYAFAVLACDLDRFKIVNDTLGHSAGDALLTVVAERLRSVVREGDMVARLGGDEFAIVLGFMDQAGDALAIARRAIEAIERPVEIGGYAMNVSVSVGIAIGGPGEADAAQMFRNADIALYRSKAAGGNAYRCFEPGMDRLLIERASLERDLRDALRMGSLSLDYQPVVLLATGAVVGFEALMRWHHPMRGRVPPSEFIPIAEETGLIVGLGEWALREACREAACWPEHLRIAVNVSAIQFRQPGLEQSVMGALSSSGISADRLELEITESVLMQDAPAVIASLHRLRAMGVRIALDDFGTGYSSLSYLRQFPFNKIKIDRAFVQEIDDPNTAAIVRAVVGLGERVGAAITAEGVETKEQLERVREEGCTEVQGYLFSAPLSADVARQIVRHVVRSAA